MFSTNQFDGLQVIANQYFANCPHSKGCLPNRVSNKPFRINCFKSKFLRKQILRKPEICKSLISDILGSSICYFFNPDSVAIACVRELLCRPAGLVVSHIRPRACTLGCVLAPLRGLDHAFPPLQLANSSSPILRG